MSSQIGVRVCPHCGKKIPDANSETEIKRIKYCVYCGLPTIMDEKDRITTMQRNILLSIQKDYSENKVPVTVAQIATKLGTSSKESVRTIIYALLKNGYVLREDWGGYIPAPKGEMYLKSEVRQE